MCGRFVLIATLEELVEKFRIAEANKISVRYNIAPSQTIAAVHEQQGARKLDSLRWGLVPFWSKETKIGYRMINARAETVSEKPVYRAPFKKRRCIVHPPAPRRIVGFSILNTWPNPQIPPII